MAIFHLSAKVLSRAKGRSAIAAAAYRHAAYLKDERTGETFDFRRKKGVEHSEIICPNQSPEWVQSRSDLWNAIEQSERRRDAQVAREVEIAIPRELSAENGLQLVRQYIKESYVSKGMIADFAIHKVPSAEPDLSKDGYDRHAHVMLTLRSINAEGFGKKVRKWNDRERINEWREAWTEAANKFLEANGVDSRIDHRTLEAQKNEALEDGDLAKSLVLDRPPQPKLGPVVAAIEKKAQKAALAKNESYVPITDRGRAHAKSKSYLADLADAALATARQNKLVQAFVSAAQRWGTKSIRRWIDERSLLSRQNDLQDQFDERRLSKKLKQSSIDKLRVAAKAIVEREFREKKITHQTRQSSRQLLRSPNHPRKTKGLER